MEVVDAERLGSLERGKERRVLGHVVCRRAEVQGVFLGPAAQVQDDSTAGLTGVAAGAAVDRRRSLEPGVHRLAGNCSGS